MKFNEALKQESKEKLIEKFGLILILITFSIAIVFELDEPSTKLQLITSIFIVLSLFLIGMTMYLNPKYWGNNSRG